MVPHHHLPVGETLARFPSLPPYPLRAPAGSCLARVVFADQDDFAAPTGCVVGIARGGPGGIRTHDARIYSSALNRMIGETIANPIDGRIQLPGSLFCLSVTLKIAVLSVGADYGPGLTPLALGDNSPEAQAVRSGAVGSNRLEQRRKERAAFPPLAGA